MPESDRADRLVETAKIRGASPLPITWLHRMELTNAFELSVWLSQHGGQPRVTSQTAAVALGTFKADLASETFLCSAPVDLAAVQSLFEETAARPTAKNGFRTYDILHVVSARLLGCDHFFSFDVKANKLAQIEALKIGPL